MNACQAIIFDMDGVIVDSEQHHERAFLDVVRAIGHAERNEIIFSSYIGRSDQILWKDFVAKHNPGYTAEKLLEMKSHRVVELIREEKPLFEGLPELVEKLAAKYRLALASGSGRTIVDAVLALRGLRRFFEATVSDSEVSKSKPAPDIFLRAAELLGVGPQACCVIEDSKPGVAAALAAGMSVIAITNTHRAAELAHATHVVNTYVQIEQLLRRYSVNQEFSPAKLVAPTGSRLYRRLLIGRASLKCDHPCGQELRLRYTREL